MDRITEAIPRPRTVTLAGRDFPVWEARLCDLADLQGWLDDRHPDPLATLHADLGAAPDESARDRLLFAAADAASEGGVSHDSAEARELFGTAEGTLFFAGVALRRGTPGLTPSDVAAVFREGPTEAELDALSRAFFGADPLREVGRILGVPRETPPGNLLSWPEAVDELARSHGWTYREIAGLTLTEFANARAGGKRSERGFRGPPEVLESLEARAVACGHRDN